MKDATSPIRTIMQALHFAVHLRTADRESITTPQGTNTALVSHAANLLEAVGLWAKPWSVAHVFKPRGDGTLLLRGSDAAGGLDARGEAVARCRASLAGLVVQGAPGPLDMPAAHLLLSLAPGNGR